MEIFHLQSNMCRIALVYGPVQSQNYLTQQVRIGE